MDKLQTTPKTAEAHNLIAGVGHCTFREYTPTSVQYLREKGWDIIEENIPGLYRIGRDGPELTINQLNEFAVKVATNGI